MKKQKAKTNNKNVMKTVKILTIILLIILVSMIGFFGIYKQDRNQMSNAVKDYSFAMDLNGARTIKLKLNDETSEETKTEESYNKSKEIIEKRLKALKIEEYNIGLNTKTGEMIIAIPEDLNTDKIVSNLNTVGKFEIIDSETNETLLDNSKIKSSDVLYNTEKSGTSVYLEIAFNKEGKSKLEEISKTYVKTEEADTTTEDNAVEENTLEETSNEEETNTENISAGEATEEKTEDSAEKKITMKIDDEEIMSTSFDEPITTGKIQLSVGTATTDTDKLQDYISQAQNIATVLDSGNLPLKYDIEKNQYILSDISEQELGYIAIAVAIVIVVGILVLVVKYKFNGLLAGISYIGLVALYLLLVRYANVVISIESIFGIATMLILNYIFTAMLLHNIEKIRKEKKENVVIKATLETYIKFFNRIIPICVISIAFCFVKWIPMSSFGMIAFWGLVLIAIYNVAITRSLLKIKVENE